MQITLSVIAGPHLGQGFSFEGRDRFLVGRSKRVHFQLQPAQGKDLRVSRIHFMIEVNPPLCRVYDLNSRNGTHINGQRLSVADLRHGDEIRAGHTVLRVELREDAPGPTVDWTGPAPAEGCLPDWLGEPAPAPVGGLSTRMGEPCLLCNKPLAEAGRPVCRACQTVASEKPQPLPGYLLLRELGRGGMGVVHLALRRADEALLAIKTVIPGGAVRPGQMERFLREASILRQLDHPYIVRFRDMGEAGGMLFFAMDYIAGVDAEKVVNQRGPLDVPFATGLLNQMLIALEYAHGQGFVHRDIKPANMMVQQLDQQTLVKLTDFGLARVYQSSQLSGLTQDNEVGGTVSFMPPEQITNFRNVQPATDQYSAAATLYYLLTGRTPYDLPADFAAQLDKILREDPVPIRRRRRDLPAGLADVIQKALQRDPGDRFAAVAAFRQALVPFAG